MEQGWSNCNWTEMLLIINICVIVIEVLNEKVIIIVIVSDCCSVHIFSQKKGTMCQLYVPINNWVKSFGANYQ